MNYSDAELLALWAQDAQPIPFARSVLAGEKAPPAEPPMPDCRHLFGVTDAWVSSGYGNGVTDDDFWRSCVAWKASFPMPLLWQGTMGAELVVPLPLERVRAWQADPLEHYGLLLSASGGFNVLFRSRESTIEATRPRLVLNAGALVLACLSDASLASSTTKALGGSTTLALQASGSRVVLRFAPIPQDIEITDAAIVLTAYKVYSKAGQVSAREVVPPLEMHPEYLRDPLERPDSVYFTSASVGFDPSASPYEANLRHQVTNPPDWKKVEYVTSEGEPHLRIIWNNRFRSGSFSIPIYRGHLQGDADPCEARIAHLRYDVLLEPNFTAAVYEGGKFPGFSSAGRPDFVPGPHPWPGAPLNKTSVLYAGNGGDNVHGNDAWSNRGGYYKGIFGRDHPALGYAPIHSYSYHLQQRRGGIEYLWHEALRRYEILKGYAPGSGYTVDNLAELYGVALPGEVVDRSVSATGRQMMWDSGAPSGIVKLGEWTRVDHLMRINTPGVSDGWIKAYINGRRVAHVEGMRWRADGPYRPAHSTLGISNGWFNFYQGGGSGYRNMTQETGIRVKNLVVDVLEWDQ
jgi:hypothetical protein